MSSAMFAQFDRRTLDGVASRSPCRQDDSMKEGRRSANDGEAYRSRDWSVSAAACRLRGDVRPAGIAGRSAVLEWQARGVEGTSGSAHRAAVFRADAARQQDAFR